MDNQYLIHQLKVSEHLIEQFSKDVHASVFSVLVSWLIHFNTKAQVCRLSKVSTPDDTCTPPSDFWLQPIVFCQWCMFRKPQKEIPGVLIQCPNNLKIPRYLISKRQLTPTQREQSDFPPPIWRLRILLGYQSSSPSSGCRRGRCFNFFLDNSFECVGHSHSVPLLGLICNERIYQVDMALDSSQDHTNPFAILR